MRHTQGAYDALFAELASTLRGGADGNWETRQEEPPAAYLHVSRPGWDDAKLDGIHLEAYVLSGQLRAGEAIVALHCEGGWPADFRELFMGLVTERVKPAIEEWNRDGDTVGELGRWEVKRPEGMSVCEVRVPFGSSPGETVDRVALQLRRLQSLAGLIDEAIEQCRCQLEPEIDTASVACQFPRQISEQEVTRNDGRDGRLLWAVIDGYVVDASKMADGHPGGLRKILSANDAATGWTGKAFGFSLSRGANAHFPKTGKKFRDGVTRFENLNRKETVEVDYSPFGVITILGTLAGSGRNHV